jgi:hypothetical protein
MSVFVITLTSGAQFRVSQDQAVRVQQAVAGNGSLGQALDLENGGSVFVTTANVESVAVEASPADS